jgi:selenocysteine lyase/cysteine desulfurase
MQPGLTRHTRRAFLREAAAGLVATTALPSLVHGLPSSRPAGPVQEPFWELVKAQFPLRPDLTMLNAANLCPAPRAVSDRVTELTRDIDADPSFQNRAKFSGLESRSREALGRYLGAEADEFVITRNTSEGNNAIVNALDFEAGDEVVIWEQNHPTNNVAWDVRAERTGLAVRRVTTPAAPRSPDELAAPFLAALTPRTRVLAFSHVSNTTGVRLPAARLCAEARTRGIRTLIDGAQTVGALQLDLHALGCDFYTSSAHKWFMGPKEAGILYIRAELAPSLWPPIVGVGWEGARARAARRLGTLGQRDDATVAAMATTVEFHEGIGVPRIEARVLELAAFLKRRIRETMPDAMILTPDDPAMSAGVVVFTVPGLDLRPAYDRLYQEHGVACATQSGGFRFCPHVYTTIRDLEQTVARVASLR